MQHFTRVDTRQAPEGRAPLRFESDISTGTPQIPHGSAMKKTSPVSRSGRFARGPGADVAKFTQSVSFDQRLWRQDILGSTAQDTIPQKIRVLSRAELGAIVRGLKTIAREIEAGPFKWKAELEDVH